MNSLAYDGFVLGFGFCGLIWIVCELSRSTSDRDRYLYLHLSHHYKSKPIALHDFAIENQISRKRAKRFLDSKTKEFNAIAITLDNGDILYHFGDTTKKLLDSRD